MPIYTRSGDKGETGLANGQRVAKNSPVVEFVGSLDELNASLGICISFLKKEKLTRENRVIAADSSFAIEIEVLESIQGDLFIVGAIAVGAKLSFDSSSEVSNIEKTIDDYEKITPQLKNFILPGGCLSAAQIHTTRTLSRKIERQAVALKSKSIEPFLPYLNRLSDLLFVMARYVNMRTKTNEIIWKS